MYLFRFLIKGGKVVEVTATNLAQAMNRLLIEHDISYYDDVIHYTIIGQN